MSIATVSDEALALFGELRRSGWIVRMDGATGEDRIATKRLGAPYGGNAVIHFYAGRGYSDPSGDISESFAADVMVGCTSVRRRTHDATCVLRMVDALVAGAIITERRVLNAATESER